MLTASLLVGLILATDGWILTLPAGLHRGSAFGNATLKPLFRSKTRGRYLDVLSDDRREHNETRIQD